MVTHDESQAARVQRTVLIADGEVVNEHFARALSALGHDQLVEIRRRVGSVGYAAGNLIIRQGEVGDRFYIITEGRADVTMELPDGREVLVDRLRPGQYFGEMALVQPGPRRATVRAAADSAVSVLALDATTFNSLIEESPRLRAELQQIVDVRATQSQVQALAHLPQDELEQLARELPVKSVPPGEIILKQGSLGRAFYLILSGEVEVYAELGDGRARQIDHRGPGDYFGEMALLGDGRRRATVRAAPSTPVRLVEISAQDFDRLRQLSPIFAASMTASAAENEARLDAAEVSSRQ
jgi:CRP-like cAMP-binding protein